MSRKLPIFRLMAGLVMLALVAHPILASAGEMDTMLTGLPSTASSSSEEFTVLKGVSAGLSDEEMEEVSGKSPALGKAAVAVGGYLVGKLVDVVVWGPIAKTAVYSKGRPDRGSGCTGMKC